MKKLILLAIILVVGICLFFLIPSHKNSNTLVAYFSATGNTKAVAERLATAIGADLFEIKPEQLYTTEDLNWRDDKSRSSVEMANKDSRPAIADKVTGMEKYKTIFIGFPIWWGREPSIVDTFVTSYDLVDKTMIPFATSGSTPSTEEAAIRLRLLAPNTSVPNGARFPVDVTAEELKTWAGEWL
ncbi:MAG: flavodoxin [Alphaproteobacteria bacterium]|nr:flavodoxin [Alphaproteobacteria bacterium]